MHTPFKQRLILRSRQGLQFVLTAELVYLKANGSYTDYFILKDGHVKCITQTGHLALHEAKLDDRFLRISKHHIVNLDFVNQIRSDRTVQLSVLITELLSVSIRYWKEIKGLE